MALLSHARPTPGPSSSLPSRFLDEFPEGNVEVVEIAIPTPRSRTTVIEHPHYYKIRNHIIHFLVERSHKKDHAAA